METMGDLLEKVREFALHSFTKEEAHRLFGWNVRDIAAKSDEKNESHIYIVFENQYILFIRYFLNLDTTETEDTCELTLGLHTDLRSRIKYDIHYAGYIHGQGYIRLRIAESKNRLQQMVLEEFYVPALKNVYKPIIQRFKGFYGQDFFGVHAEKGIGEIFYAPVRSRSEHKSATIGEVMGKLAELDLLLKEPKIRHDLAEIDLQLSLLPSLVWPDL
ncbi:MAG: hypothetical protein A4E49_02677 [Methanosaeta sp. PtaU1.Bin112]|nr:MAG: hypothetical protein A4E49_02677 [Methanosaeta sp. PtaU1.Bin112]